MPKVSNFNQRQSAAHAKVSKQPKVQGGFPSIKGPSTAGPSLPPAVKVKAIKPVVKAVKPSADAAIDEFAIDQTKPGPKVNKIKHATKFMVG